jgi:hypothetical protein
MKIRNVDNKQMLLTCNFLLSLGWCGRGEGLKIIHRSKFQRWAPALFSRFRAREREAKKERESAKKKEREKSESAEHERKKARIRAVSPPHSRNPVSEPKAARQGESKGLE